MVEPEITVPPGGWLVLRRPDGQIVRASIKTFERIYREQGYVLADPDDAGPLRVLAHVHKAVPQHNAGAEWMLHTLLRELVRQGHEAKVSVRDGRKASFEGVELLGAPKTERTKAYGWADVILTHLDCTAEAMAEAAKFRKPLVHLVHNNRQLGFHGVKDAALVVFNSQWIATEGGWEGTQIIVRPPVVASDYRVRSKGEAITLVNLTEPKGASTFFSLARAMPDRSFLAVRGAYGLQVTPGDVPNVEFVPNTADMKPIYRKTRILLMPSNYESWGRVGIEAAASGIPTIAHPTPGLLESLGDAGTFVDRDDLAGWIRAIENLDDVKTYAGASKAARARSGELDPTEDLATFTRALLRLSPRHRFTKGAA